MIRNLIAIAALSASLAPALALAQEAGEPTPLNSNDRRMQMLTYRESDVYTIQTRYGYQTSIVFGNGEEIQTVSVGDRSPWQIVPAGNRLFIRPMLENVTTNMTILTTRRSYQFDLKSAGSESDDIGGKASDVVYVAKFTYPEDEAKKRAKEQQAQFTLPYGSLIVPQQSAGEPARPTIRVPTHTGPTTPENPNRSYTFSGPDDLAPMSVYDDGTSTYIKYRDTSQPIPNVYIPSSVGETPVPTRIANNYVVVDVVAGELLLKNSNGTVHVYNEVINPQ